MKNVSNESVREAVRCCQSEYVAVDIAKKKLDEACAAVRNFRAKHEGAFKAESKRAERMLKILERRVFDARNEYNIAEDTRLKAYRTSLERAENFRRAVQARQRLEHLQRQAA